jgi:predicted transcriptional regulator
MEEVIKLMKYEQIFVFRANDELNQLLEKVAKEKNKSKSMVVRAILKDYFYQIDPKLRRKLKIKSFKE